MWCYSGCMRDYPTELAAAARRYRKAQAALQQARDELAQLVRDASEAGVRQADILRATDHVWAREHVRRVLDQEPADG